jgi:hypothetical protein
MEAVGHPRSRGPGTHNRAHHSWQHDISCEYSARRWWPQWWGWGALPSMSRISAGLHFFCSMQRNAFSRPEQIAGVSLGVRRSMSAIAWSPPHYSSTKVVLFPLLAPNLATKIRFDFYPARMSGPIGGCGSPENILQVQSCTAFDKEPDYFIVPSPGSLV